MKHKEKECTWAPGTQDTDVTFAGDHTWGAIMRAQKEQAGDSGVSRKTTFLVLALGIVILGAGVWFFA